MPKRRSKTRLSTESGFLTLAVLIEIMQQAASRGGPAPLPHIADSLGISLSYAEKLVIQLRDAGLATSVRGVNGGYLPAKPS
jgi:DNA-binding IscR family transcriptional regulator